MNTLSNMSWVRLTALLPSVCTVVPVLLRVTTGVQPGVGKLQGQDSVVVLLVEYAVNEGVSSEVDGE